MRSLSISGSSSVRAVRKLIILPDNWTLVLFFCVCEISQHGFDAIFGVIYLSSRMSRNGGLMIVALHGDATGACKTKQMSVTNLEALKRN